MRALICNAYGSTDELLIEERDDPVAGDGQLAIDIKVAGINFPDILSIAGEYQDKTPPPFIPGNEAAGVITAVGENVTGYAVGDKVIAAIRGKAFAEKCVAKAQVVMPLPPELDFEQGAGYAVTYGTSYHALKQSADIQAGETLLVLGAAGGVGSAAVEIGKALGARVIAAASSDEKLAFAKESGADELINYTEKSLREAVKELTDGAGVDVVYDPVGGDLAQQALRSLAWHGRYLVVGFAAGDIPQFPANIALLKEASIIGVWWGTWLAKNPKAQIQNMQELGVLLASGKLRPRITESYALDDFKQAFRAISERRAVGKVVLRMS
jgi:NADPH2:quinone reductase